MPFEETEQAKDYLVRLFPTVRIATTGEAETRATAALLAMLRAVSEFGRVIVKLAGGPAGKIECYTEVPLVDHSQTPPLSLRPDGLLVVAGRGKRWRCFVEVKVGSSPMERPQLENYLQLAKQEGIDALISISNEAGLGNLGLNKAQTKVELLHLSWERLLSEARLLCSQGSVGDTDQQWMLNEWIQYVSDPTSRIIDPPTLGQYFGELLTAAREGNMAAAGAAVRDVCGYWDGFLNKAAHRLRADLGVDVHPILTNAEKQSHDLRINNLHSVVSNESRLTGSLRVKNAASEIRVDVLLPSRTVRFGIDVKAPTEGKQLTRLKWMVKQLAKAPSSARIQVQWDQKRLKSQDLTSKLDSELRSLLRDLQGQPIPSDALPKLFTIEWTQDLQKAKGRSTAAILDGVMADLERFYRQVVEGITAFVPSAPKLPVATAPELGAEPSPAPVQMTSAVVPTPETRVDADTASPDVEPPAESGEIVRNDVVSEAGAERASQPPPERPSGSPGRAANG
jgi:hypothetical protein